PKAMQIGAARLVAASCCGQARLGVVSATDRRLAEVDTSEKRGASSVARDHLSEPLCADARRLEKTADRASALTAGDPPLATCDDERQTAGPNPRCCFDQPATGVGCGPRRARPLGGRSLMRIEEQLHRHAGGATLALRDAGQGPQ